MTPTFREAKFENVSARAAEIGRSGPANAGRRRMPAPRAGDIQCDAGGAIRAFTASTSALMRARIAAFEPTSASDDAMIR